jgi:hypothetical protein
MCSMTIRCPRKGGRAPRPDPAAPRGGTIASRGAGAGLRGRGWRRRSGADRTGRRSTPPARRRAGRLRLPRLCNPAPRSSGCAHAADRWQAPEGATPVPRQAFRSRRRPCQGCGAPPGRTAAHPVRARALAGRGWRRRSGADGPARGRPRPRGAAPAACSSRACAICTPALGLRPRRGPVAGPRGRDARPPAGIAVPSTPPPGLRRPPAGPPHIRFRRGLQPGGR